LSEYESIPSEDDRVKVNSIVTPRKLNISGTGVTVTDNPTNKTIDINIPSASARGLFTQASDGSTKTFIIPHGITTGTPVAVIVQPKNTDSLGSMTVSVDTTNITVTYSFAPPAVGTINLYWVVYL
jgi:hypothetical protein